MIQISARIFPLGFLIEVDNATFNPNDFYIDGVWERFGNGKVIVGVDESDSDFNATGKIGGNKKLHKHTHLLMGEDGVADGIYSVPRSTGIISKWYNGNTKFHSAVVGETGEGNSQNLQPYVVAYRWKLISYSD